MTILYGSGGFGKNLAFTIVSTYTLYYYNSVLNINATFVGILLMLARIFDAFNDPFMGVIVEKTKSRFGKYKPWILSGAILNAFVLFAMFSVPQGLEGSGVKFYIAITYFLCGITYTLSDIPYWAIIPAITKPGKEREYMTVLARTFTGIGSGIAIIFTMYLVTKLGGGTDTNAYRHGFSLLAGIIAVIYAITTILAVYSLPKEVSQSEYDENDTSNHSVLQLFKILLKNDQALMVSLIVTLFYTATNLTINLAIYVFDYDLARPDQYTIFMAIIGVAQLFSMAVLYILLRFILSNRRIFIIACVLALVGYAVFTLNIPADQWSFHTILIPGILISMAIGLAYVLVTVFVANAVDYGEQKTGVRENSMTSSLQTLMVKISSAAAVLIAGIGIDFIGFVGEGLQAPQVLMKLHILIAIPSLLIMALALFFTIKRKDL